MIDLMMIFFSVLFHNNIHQIHFSFMKSRNLFGLLLIDFLNLHIEFGLHRNCHYLMEHMVLE